MRIVRIDIDGFGRHVNRSFELDERAPITLFYGHNEAGKSTLMGFIRAMLFGIATRSNMPERYEPRNGAPHGGSLTLRDREAIWKLERYEYGKNAGSGSRSSSGKLKVMLSNGSIGGEELLRPLLGGISQEVYRNLFAFGLGELQEIRTLQSDEINSYLFSTSMGLGGQAIPRLERSLAQEMEQLYKPRGTKQEIYLATKAIEAGEAALRKSKECVDQFNEWTRELAELDSRMERDEEALAEARRSLEWLDKCQQVRERCLRLQEIRGEWRQLPGFADFPENAVERLDALLVRQEQLRNEESKIKYKRENVQETMDGISIDTELMHQEGELAELTGQLGVYQEQRTQAVELSNNLLHLKEELQQIIRSVDPQWDEEKLAAFPLTIADHEQIRRFRERNARLQSEKMILEADLERLNAEERAALLEAGRTRDELSAMKDQNQTVLKVFKPLSSEQFTLLWNEYLHEFSTWKQLGAQYHALAERLTDVQRNMEWTAHSQKQQSAPETRQRRASKGSGGNAQGENDRYRSLLLAAGVIVNIGIPAYLFLAEDSWPAATVSFVILTVLHSLGWMQYKTFRTRLIHTEANEPLQAFLEQQHRQADRFASEKERLGQQLHQVEQKIQSLARRLLAEPKAAATIAGGGQAAADTSTSQNSLSSALKEQFMNELQQSAEQWKAAEINIRLKTNALEEQNRTLASINLLKSETMEKLSLHEGKLLALDAEWNEWLQRCNLKPGHTAEAVLEIVPYAEKGNQLLKQRQRNAEKLDTLRQNISQFEMECSRLLGSGNPEQIPVLLKQRKEAADRQAVNLQELRGLEAVLQELDAEQNALKEALGRIELKLHSLFQEAGAEGEEQLRHKASQHDKRLRLEHEIRQEEIFLDAWVGPARRGKLEETLIGHDALQLNAEIGKLNETIQQFMEELDELKDRRGRLRSELEKLQNGAEHAEKLQFVEERYADLQQLTKRWSVLSLCSELIKTAKQKYERERQPDVLLKASEYFKLITGGQFVRIMIPLGQKQIIVERSTGEMVETAYLSRGTAEQLYLSMRFALADEYARQASLPIVMDDIFVNFDMARLRNALQAVHQVAASHQILLFTCHAHIRNAVAESFTTPQMIDL